MNLFIWNIKRYLGSKWGKLVNIGLNYTGIPGEFGYFKNVVEVHLPLKLKEFLKDYDSLQAEIKKLLNLVKITPEMADILQKLEIQKTIIEEQIEKFKQVLIIK